MLHTVLRRHFRRRRSAWKELSKMSKRGENIYKRKDGRWEGRYIKCRTLHGRIQYGYVYGKSYSAVKSKLKETASMPIQTSDSRGTQPTSYSEILKMWLLSAKNHVKESTFSRYNHLVERHIQPFLGGYQIGEISNALLEKYIDHLLQCGRLDGSGGLSPKSVSDILVVIKRSMRYAQENNHLVICSTAGLSVKRSRNNMRVLSKIEQRQLEKHPGSNTRITMRLDIPLRQGVLNWGLRLRVWARS